MHRQLEMTRLIHDNFGIVMSYAYSRPKLEEIAQEKFEGEWKYLWRSFELIEVRADRALLNLAMQLRILDDMEYDKSLGQNWKELSFGDLAGNNGDSKSLNFRQMTNKIIHASEYGWDSSNPNEPRVVCTPANESDWIKAEVQLLSIWSVVGVLMV